MLELGSCLIATIKYNLTSLMENVPDYKLVIYIYFLFLFVPEAHLLLTIVCLLLPCDDNILRPTCICTERVLTNFMAQSHLLSTLIQNHVTAYKNNGLRRPSSSVDVDRPSSTFSTASFSNPLDQLLPYLIFSPLGYEESNVVHMVPVCWPNRLLCYYMVKTL